MDVTVDGFANMGSAGGATIYIYTLTFSGMTGTATAGDTGCGAGAGATGVTFTRVSGPNVSVTPNGGTFGGVTYDACKWVTPTQFRFVYSVPQNQTLLNSSSVVTLSFAANKLAAPGSGTYSAVFTAGANNQYALSTWCFQDCPVDYVAGAAPAVITIDIDANGGNCKTSKVTGTEGTWGVAPDATDCTRAGYNFAGYNTSADGSGISIAPGGNINFTGDNRVYAQWVDPRAAVVTASAPKNVVATSKWQRVQVNWDAPESSGTYPITNYLVKASPGGAVCITKLADAKFTQCSLNRLTPGTKYTVQVQALTGAGWGAFSTASNVASPYEIKIAGYGRKKLNVFNLFRSEVSARGTALGYPAGTKIHSWYKVGENGTWTKGDPVSSNQESKFSWTKKFDRKLNSTSIWVAFSVEAPGGKWNKNAKFNDPNLDKSQEVRVPGVS